MQEEESQTFEGADLIVFLSSADARLVEIRKLCERQTRNIKRIIMRKERKDS